VVRGAGADHGVVAVLIGGAADGSGLVGGAACFPMASDRSCPPVAHPVGSALSPAPTRSIDSHRLGCVSSPSRNAIAGGDQRGVLGGVEHGRCTRHRQGAITGDQAQGREVAAMRSSHDRKPNSYRRLNHAVAPPKRAARLADRRRIASCDADPRRLRSSPRLCASRTRELSQK